MDFSLRNLFDQALYPFFLSFAPAHELCQRVQVSRNERTRLKRLRFIRVSFSPFTKEAAVRYVEERSRADNRRYFLPTSQVLKYQGEKIVDNIEPGPEMKRTTPQPRLWGLEDDHKTVNFYSPTRGSPYSFRSDSTIPWLAPGVALLYLFWDPAQ